MKFVPVWVAVREVEGDSLLCGHCLQVRQSGQLGLSERGLHCPGVHGHVHSHVDWSLAYLCLSSLGLWEQRGHKHIFLLGQVGWLPVEKGYKSLC